MKKVLFSVFFVLCGAVSLWAGTSDVKGDVNGDGVVDVSDVASLVDHLLTGRAISGNGDTNGDGVVDVSDIAALVDNLLRGTGPSDPAQGGTFTVNGVESTMVPVEGGTFTMGATAEQGDDWWYDEYPAHEVTLSSYSIGETPVTQELWLAVMGSNPSHCNGGTFGTNLQRPVEYVTWNDCQTFIAKLNQMTGKHFRLPTEAEWEFAARGGNKSQRFKYSGSNDIDEVAWYEVNAYDVGSSSPDYGTHPVGKKKCNELGLYDMSGNVYEWCQDWWGSYSSAAQTNPTGPSSGSYRVFRGGSWFNDASYCRVSYRDYNSPTYRYYIVGLRLAL